MSPVREDALAALRECADDLEAELRERYGASGPEGVHPAQEPKFRRDMRTVEAARHAIVSLQAQQPMPMGLYWMVERTVEGRAHWLRWRGIRSWTPNAHEADRYTLALQAGRDARWVHEHDGVKCVVTEHRDIAQPTPQRLCESCYVGVVDEGEPWTPICTGCLEHWRKRVEEACAPQPTPPDGEREPRWWADMEEDRHRFSEDRHRFSSEPERIASYLREIASDRTDPVLRSAERLYLERAAELLLRSSPQPEARSVAISGALPLECSVCGRSVYEHPGGGRFVPCQPEAKP